MGDGRRPNPDFDPDVFMDEHLKGMEVGDWVASYEYPGFIELTHKRAKFKDGKPANREAQYRIMATPDHHGPEDLAVYLQDFEGNESTGLDGDCLSEDSYMPWTGDYVLDEIEWKTEVLRFIACIEPKIFPADKGPFFDPFVLKIIDEHRRGLGMRPIDTSAGWTPDELKQMADNIVKHGREFNPSGKLRWTKQDDWLSARKMLVAKTPYGEYRLRRADPRTSEYFVLWAPAGSKPEGAQLLNASGYPVPHFRLTYQVTLDGLRKVKAWAQAHADREAEFRAPQAAGMVKVMNLSTGETVTFSLEPRRAVAAAYAQGTVRDFQSHSYAEKYEPRVRESDRLGWRIFNLGDWSAAVPWAMQQMELCAVKASEPNPAPNPDDKISDAEYQRRVVDAYQRFPERTAETVAFTAAVDHRLGRSFPEERRGQLWTAVQRLRRRTPWVALFRGQGALRPLAERELGAVLTPSEVQAYLGY